MSFGDTAAVRAGDRAIDVVPTRVDRYRLTKVNRDGRVIRDRIIVGARISSGNPRTQFNNWRGASRIRHAGLKVGSVLIGVEGAAVLPENRRAVARRGSVGVALVTSCCGPVPDKINDV